jgi:glutathione-regulated potassium-efflux system ancillary protein KefF
MICVIHAHPYPRRSRVNRALADALSGLPDLDFRSLYVLYPDFDIDVVAEQKALANAQLIVWMHPLYWYSVRACSSTGSTKCLNSTTYGDGAAALQANRACGSPRRAATGLRATGLHATRSRASVPPIEQTAHFAACTGAPYIVHGADDLDDAQLSTHAADLLQRLAPWRGAARPKIAETAP